MRTLLTKAMRAIWRHKKTYIACIVLITVGVAMFVNFAISGNALQTAKTRYYSETGFADAFAKVRGISEAEASDLEIEGVSDVLARVSVDSRVNIEDSEKIVKLRLLSRNYGDINQIDLKSEDISQDNDILMSQSYMDAWGLGIGDEVELIIGGKLVKFIICGTFLSPEYVYIIDDAGSLMPDEATFNIAVVNESVLQRLTVGEGMFNDLSFRLDAGVEFNDVKVELEDALGKFGLISLTSQKDQLSNAMLTSEIDGIVAMGNSVPMVFIGMSIVILYLMLKRIIEQERAQVGTLKAFGYTNTQILLSYAFYGLLTGLVGGLLGSLCGYLLSGAYLRLFQEFFKMPNLVPVGIARACVFGVVIALIGGAAGSIMGAKSMLQLSPADSMRPAAPIVKHKVHHGFWDNWLSTTGQMAMRSITRNKVRSLFVVGGIMLSFGMLTFMGSYSSMIDDMLLVQYSQIQVYHGKLNFKVPVQNAQDVAERIGRVEYAEGITELPAEISLRNRSKTAVITGMDAQSTLLRIYDTERKRVFPPPDDGIILTNALAERLEAKIGDYVTINKRQVKVIEVVEQSMGLGAYVEKSLLNDIMDFTGGDTAALVLADDMTEIKELAKEGENIVSFDDQASTRKQMQDMMAPYVSLTYVFLIFGIIIAFAICYNTASIALMERKREYSTLRVLGMQMKEVAGILGFEYWLLGSVGIALGVPLAKLIKVGIANMVDIEQFSMPTSVSLQSLIIGLGCTLLAIYLSNHSNVRNIRRLDMVEVLKERE